MRELGRYMHIHIPYNGGYGPYTHVPNPYLHYEPQYSASTPYGTYRYLTHSLHPSLCCCCSPSPCLSSPPILISISKVRKDHLREVAEKNEENYRYTHLVSGQGRHSIIDFAHLPHPTFVVCAATWPSPRGSHFGTIWSDKKQSNRQSQWQLKLM